MGRWSTSATRPRRNRPIPKPCSVWGSPVDNVFSVTVGETLAGAPALMAKPVISGGLAGGQPARMPPSNKRAAEIQNTFFMIFPLWSHPHPACSTPRASVRIRRVRVNRWACVIERSSRAAYSSLASRFGERRSRAERLRFAFGTTQALVCGDSATLGNGIIRG